MPAFEQEWTAALEESRRTFSLAGLYEIVQDWQGRLASAPAVDAFVASGYDDSEFIDMGGAPQAAPVTEQPYAVRFPAPAAKALTTLPEHVEDTVWDVLGAAGDPWGFRQWNADPEGEEVRHASVGQLSLTYSAAPTGASFRNCSPWPTRWPGRPDRGR